MVVWGKVAKTVCRQPRTIEDEMRPEQFERGEQLKRLIWEKSSHFACDLMIWKRDHGLTQTSIRWEGLHSFFESPRWLQYFQWRNAKDLQICKNCLISEGNKLDHFTVLACNSFPLFFFSSLCSKSLLTCRGSNTGAESFGGSWLAMQENTTRNGVFCSIF